MTHRYFENNSCRRENNYLKKQNFPKLVKLPKRLVSSLERVIPRKESAESVNPVEIIINIEIG